MDPKQRKALLEQIQRVKNIMDQHPYLEAAFPNVKAKVEQVHNSIAYQKVDEKDHALIVLNAKRLKALDAFCEGIEAFRGSLESIPVDGALLQRWLKAEKLQVLTASIQKGLGGDPVFNLALSKMVEVVEKMKGGSSLESLREQLKTAGLSALSSINTDLLKETRSLKAVRGMNNPILEEFFFARINALPNKFEGPNLSLLGAKLSECYQSAYFMTLADFQKNVQDWIAKVQGDLNKLGTDTYRQVGVSVSGVGKDLAAQFGGLAGKNPVFTLIAKELDTLVKQQAEGSNISSLSQALSKGMNGLAALLKPSEQDLQKIEEANWVAQTLKDYIDLGSLILQHANRNDAHFLVKLDNFPTELRSRLNAWKASLENAMGRASGTVLALDSCKINGPSLVATLSAKIKISAITQKFQALSSLKNTLIHDQKDLALFEKAFITPWKTCIQSIDVEKDLIAPYQDDEKMLAQLFLSPHELLPDANDAIEALYLAIGSKRDLAREELKKFEEKVDKKFKEIESEITLIKEDVKEIKEVNSLQQISLSMSVGIDEIQFLINEVLLSHKQRVSVIHQYTRVYLSAEANVSANLKAINKVIEDVKYWRDLVYGVIKGAVVAGLVATGVGALGLATAEGATLVAVEIGKKASEEVLNAVYDGLFKPADLEKLSTDGMITPFQVYLDLQIKADAEIEKALMTLQETYFWMLNLAKFAEKVSSKTIEIGPNGAGILVKASNLIAKALQSAAKEQRAKINAYRKQTQAIAAAISLNDFEYNLYIAINQIEFKKEKNGDIWKAIANATNNGKAFRERLIELKMITADNFQDGYIINSDWEKDLDVLYANKAKQLFH